jgi:HTH-type transcriptional regulator/antitoxin HigA
MATRTAVRPAHATYLRLVRAFPLRRISSAAELKAALAIADELLRSERDEGADDYLDVLADLIEKYERESFPAPDMTDVGMLRYLMEVNNLTQPQLAEKVGIAQSTLSAVLTGKRTLRKEHMVKLGQFFKVSPAVFMPRADAGAAESRAGDE